MKNSSDSAQFLASIETLRRDRGDRVSLDSVGEIVASLLESLDGDLTPAENLDDDRGAANKVDFEQLGPELFPLLTTGFRDEGLRESAAHLSEAIAESEEAANAILEAGEAIEEVVATVSGEAARKMLGIVTRIYEASNFQDIGGQRITKAMKTIREVADRLDQVAAVIGSGLIEEMAPEKEGARSEEENLLHGPQHHGQANTQEEIDALLASFD